MFHKAGAMADKAHLLKYRSLNGDTHSMPFLPELVDWAGVTGEKLSVK